MAGFRREIAPGVAEVIRHLSPNVKRAVRSSIDVITANPAVGEALQGELKGLLKVPVGRHRIVYRVDTSSRSIRIVAVGKRRNIYEELAELLRRQK